MAAKTKSHKLYLNDLFPKRVSLFLSLDCDLEIKFPVHRSLVTVGITEAVVQKCSVKKALLKNLQNLRRNKIRRPQACNIIKKEILAQVFSGEFYEIFFRTSFL